jgi:hypothetical protein
MAIKGRRRQEVSNTRHKKAMFWQTAKLGPSQSSLSTIALHSANALSGTSCSGATKPSRSGKLLQSLLDLRRHIRPNCPQDRPNFARRDRLIGQAPVAGAIASALNRVARKTKVRRPRSVKLESGTRGCHLRERRKVEATTVNP